MNKHRPKVSLLAAAPVALATVGKRLARRVLSFGMRARLRLSAEPWPARPPTACTLVIAPHPDDEVLGCGGLISTRIANGETVHVAYLTDGMASHPQHPFITPVELGALRRAEAFQATALLGVPPAHLHFLNAPDGRLPHLTTDEKARLALALEQLIRRLNPAEIFITSRSDGSSEHTAASQLLQDVMRSLPEVPRLFEYCVWSRWSPQRLHTVLQASTAVHRCQFPGWIARKRSALLAYRTQVKPLAPDETPVLSEEFLSYFDHPEEFFFACPP